MQRRGKSDIKVGVVQGGEKKGEVISGDRADRKQRDGGTMRDHIRVNSGSSHGENGHKGKLCKTTQHPSSNYFVQGRILRRYLNLKGQINNNAMILIIKRCFRQAQAVFTSYEQQIIKGTADEQFMIVNGCDIQQLAHQLPHM